jgi:hypothetical protein
MGAQSPHGSQRRTQHDCVSPLKKEPGASDFFHKTELMIAELLHGELLARRLHEGSPLGRLSRALVRPLTQKRRARMRVSSPFLAARKSCVCRTVNACWVSGCVCAVAGSNAWEGFPNRHGRRRGTVCQPSSEIRNVSVDGHCHASIIQPSRDYRRVQYRLRWPLIAAVDLDSGFAAPACLTA